MGKLGPNTKELVLLCLGRKEKCVDNKKELVLFCLGRQENFSTHNSDALKGSEQGTLNFAWVFLKIDQCQYFKASKGERNKSILYYFVELGVCVQA